MRAALFGAVAISGDRKAKNSWSCNLIRSQGGFPSTTSNPPFLHDIGKGQVPVKERVLISQFANRFLNTGTLGNPILYACEIFSVGDCLA